MVGMLQHDGIVVSRTGTAVRRRISAAPRGTWGTAGDVRSSRHGRSVGWRGSSATRPTQRRSRPRRSRRAMSSSRATTFCACRASSCSARQRTRLPDRIAQHGAGGRAPSGRIEEAIEQVAIALTVWREARSSWAVRPRRETTHRTDGRNGSANRVRRLGDWREGW